MMGIKIFLSSFTYKALLAYKELYPKSEMNILLSYGTRSPDYYEMINSSRNMINELICDSGAFTKNFASAKTAAKISLDGFISFCKQPRVKESFNFFFNYDEDFRVSGFETNLRNMLKMEENGIEVVPVVHDYLGDHFDEIGYYLDSKYPIIALGYSEHKIKNKKENIVNVVNRIVTAGAKVHLLGISSYDILTDIPVHYCDSSSWAQEGKYGCILWWNLNKSCENKTDRIRFLDRDNSHECHKQHIENYSDKESFLKYLNDNLNMTLVDLYGHDKEHNRQLVNVHFFVQLQDELRKAHKQKGFKIN